MTNTYQIVSLKHPSVDHAIQWNHELWLDTPQLKCLFRLPLHTLKRKINHLLHNQSEALAHTHCFSVVKMRKSANSDIKREWIYQIRCYDTWFVQALQTEYESSEALSFLHCKETLLPNKT